MVKQKLRQQTITNKNFDVIVIGIGSMGSSACYHLAKQGFSVLGIDQFDVPHKYGSHAGQTRIIRKAYFEHPDYVPLLQTAYDNWSKIEEESREQLWHKTGLMYFGEPDNPVISGVCRSASKYDVEVNELSPDDLFDQFPQFSIPNNYKRLMEPDAGYLIPEKAISVYLDQAINTGAIIKPSECIVSYLSSGSGIEVKTDKGSYSCKKMVVTTGAWTRQFLPAISSHLKVTRQMFAWMRPKKEKLFEVGKFPCWTMAHPEGKGIYYGFPIVTPDSIGAPIGLKIGHHFPGDETDPNKVSRETSMEEENNLIQFLNEFIPDGYESMITTQTCLYTNSLDDNFIIDLHPENKDIVLATGFSGHGFKFASVVGEILADLAIKGKTDLPISFLSLNRFY